MYTPSIKSDADVPKVVISFDKCITGMIIQDERDDKYKEELSFGSTRTIPVRYC